VTEGLDVQKLVNISCGNILGTYLWLHWTEIIEITGIEGRIILLCLEFTHLHQSELQSLGGR